MHVRACAVAMTALTALSGTGAAAEGDGRGVVFTDPAGDTSPSGVAARPLVGDGSLDLTQVSLRVVAGELRVAVTTHGPPAVAGFAGYDVTAGSTGRCARQAVPEGFPVELRVRAGEAGRGSLVVKACSARLVLPVRVSGRTVEGRIPLSALPEVRRTVLFGIQAVAGLTDSPDDGTMRVHVDDAATRSRLRIA